MFAEEVEPIDALMHSIEFSDKSFSIFDEAGAIHGFWGHGCLEAATERMSEGYVWLLSDDILFTRYPIAITRIARDLIFPILDEEYTQYGNSVMSSNHVHLDWLHSNGFKCTGTSTHKGVQFSTMKRGRNL